MEYEICAPGNALFHKDTPDRLCALLRVCTSPLHHVKGRRTPVWVHQDSKQMLQSGADCLQIDRRRLFVTLFTTSQ